MKRFTILCVIAWLLTGVGVRADITNGLVAYYNFEGLSGIVGETVVDQSGRGHDGVCRQDQNTLKAPTIVSGPDGLGDALNFDGNFYVQIPNSPDFNLTSNITCAAWVSVDGFNQAWQTIFCRGDWSWRLHRENTTDYAAFHMSGLSGGYGADGATTDIAVPKRWLHLVGTYQNGVGARLYINGSLEAENTNASGLINTSGNDPVTIGAWINNGTLSRQWLGQIDEVRLYNRALGPADVTELYDFTLTNYNSRPAVTVPGSLVFNAPTNVQLTATVKDDGNPLPANTNNPAPADPNKLRWGWSVVSAPAASAGVVWSGNPTNGEAFTYAGSPNPPETLFTCDPTASFDAPGLYSLNFTATDGEKTNSQNVSVWVHSTDDYRQLG
ncbi:MAG TPA: LamG domain-containing protein, partial [Verrucomicrobiae bacterium]|nr:LamG domain-containing protein [Verrucomicrobiae bacterium]